MAFVAARGGKTERQDDKETAPRRRRLSVKDDLYCYDKAAHRNILSALDSPGVLPYTFPHVGERDLLHKENGDSPKNIHTIDIDMF